MFYSVLSGLMCFVLHVISPNIFPKPLPSKDEKKYLNLLSKGDKNAKDKLIKHNLRLVAHIVKKYYSSKNYSEDLISIGTIGLIKAINTFNLDKGIKLSSYAARCIENEVLMYLRNAKKTSLDVSMNEPIEMDKNGNALTIIDTIPSDECIDEKIFLKLDIQKLQKNIYAFLNSRERIIISLRYGLGGHKPLPQREVAKLLGISRSYVSRLEKKSLEKLKKVSSKLNRKI